MAYQGINHRASAGFVADGAGETYSLGAAYPITRGGQTFGWSVSNTANARDRASAGDRRVAGTSYTTGAAIDFRMDLASTGVGTIRLALGDLGNGASLTQYAQLLDGGTVFATISATSASNEMLDATGTPLAADTSGPGTWTAANTAITHTFTSTNFTVRLGNGTVGARLAHVSVDMAAADTTAPTLSSAVVSNATPTVVTLNMSETMDTGNVPAATAFTVTGHTVSSVSISGSVISLTCSAPFVFGETARTVSYTQPGTANARDVAGNLLGNFTTQAITNNVAATDTTAPAFNSALVSNAARSDIVITMSETLAAFTPAASAFGVSGGKTVSSVARSGATLTLTVNAPYAYGDAITVTYTKPGSNMIQDAAGNQTASFGPSSVANNIASPTSTISSTKPIGHKALGTLANKSFKFRVRSMAALDAAPYVKTGVATGADGKWSAISTIPFAAGTALRIELEDEADNTAVGFLHLTAT